MYLYKSEAGPVGQRRSDSFVRPRVGVGRTRRIRSIRPSDRPTGPGVVCIHRRFCPTERNLSATRALFR